MRQWPYLDYVLREWNAQFLDCMGVEPGCVGTGLNSPACRVDEIVVFLLRYKKVILNFSLWNSNNPWKTASLVSLGSEYRIPGKMATSLACMAPQRFGLRSSDLKDFFIAWRREFEKALPKYPQKVELSLTPTYINSWTWLKLKLLQKILNRLWSMDGTQLIK